MTAEDLVLIGLAIAAWLFWKWFNSGLDGIPDPVHPVIQRVVVVHEYPHSRIDQS